MSSDELKFMNSEQLAKYLRSIGVYVSRRTLESWRVFGGGPIYTKVGSGKRGRVVYEMNDVREWLLSSKRARTCDQTVHASKRR